MKNNSTYFTLLSEMSRSSALLNRAVQDCFVPRTTDGSKMHYLLVTYSSPYSEHTNRLTKEGGINQLLPVSNYSPIQKEEYLLLDISINKSHRGIPPSSMKSEFKEDTRGLTLQEGLWLTLLYPFVLNNQAIDLVGSIYSIECVPTIYKWGDKKYLSAVCPDVSDNMCGAPVVERELLLSPRDLTNTDIFMGKIRTLYSTDLKGV